MAIDLPLTTEAAYQFIHAVPGDELMPREDTLALMAIASELTTDLPIVEIGTYEGRLAEVLARLLQELGKPNRIIAIDPFDEFVDPKPEWPTVTGSEQRTRDRLKAFPAVQVITGYAEDPKVYAQVEQLGGIAMLFVDGNHTQEFVRKDLELYLPLVREHALCHDTNYPEVIAGISEAGATVTRRLTPTLWEVAR